MCITTRADRGHPLAGRRIGGASNPGLVRRAHPPPPTRRAVSLGPVATRAPTTPVAARPVCAPRPQQRPLRLRHRLRLAPCGDPPGALVSLGVRLRSARRRRRRRRPLWPPGRCAGPGRRRRHLRLQRLPRPRPHLRPSLPLSPSGSCRCSAARGAPPNSRWSRTPQGLRLSLSQVPPIAVTGGGEPAAARCARPAPLCSLRISGATHAPCTPPCGAALCARRRASSCMLAPTCSPPCPAPLAPAPGRSGAAC